MEKFDINKFEKNKSEEGYYVFNLNNEEKITQDKWGEEYSEKIEYKNNPFILLKNYNIKGNIKLKGQQFHESGFQNGIWREFNDTGELIKETNYDVPYKNFSWEKVEEYLKSKNVNLMDGKTNVSRNERQNNIPIWYLSWDTGKKDDSSFQIIQNVEIDATSGKVIKEYQISKEP
ncbi:hypothetical protein [Kaistella jeonii]|uniref:hypothetical protein n=1 Tax=Kaistella jeonii TaxID=266749 RepID=UPI000F8435A5|nr:hypothetical protein [Kaistella jeonii]